MTRLAVATGEGQELIGAESGAKSRLLQALHRLMAATGLAVVLLEKHPPPFLHEVHLGVGEEAAAFADGLGNGGQMIVSVAEITAFLSGSTTLLPGTVILTGIPEGVGMAHRQVVAEGQPG